MNVLVFTSLYPNNIWTHHGVFIKERMTRCGQAGTCHIKVVAPVPYFPPLKFAQRARYAQVRRQEIIEGIEVYHPRYFMIPKISMLLHGLFIFMSVLCCVKKLQKSFDFDLIDAHYVYPDGFAAVLLGAVFDKPVVVSARGSDINVFRQFPLIRRFLRYTLQKAAAVIAVSQALKEAMVALPIPAEKIIVIPNGIDVVKFHPLPRPAARQMLGLPDKTILLSVGRLSPNKGQDLLIKALHHLLTVHQRDDLYLVLIGEGDAQNELEQLIVALHMEAYVRLVGDVPHHELTPWYSAANLFCLVSAREGWPNVLLEALACGLPVLATAVGGIPELICSTDVGLLTERHELAIAQSMTTALARSWQADQIAQYAATYTWDKVSQSVLHIFHTVLADQRPSKRLL